MAILVTVLTHWINFSVTGLFEYKFYFGSYAIRPFGFTCKCTDNLSSTQSLLSHFSHFSITVIARFTLAMTSSNLGPSLDTTWSFLDYRVYHNLCGRIGIHQLPLDPLEDTALHGIQCVVFNTIVPRPLDPDYSYWPKHGQPNIQWKVTYLLSFRFFWSQ